MIKRKTVFVLGAGAHQSYSFPSGEQLKEMVATHLINARGLEGASDLHELVRLGLYKEDHGRFSFDFCKNMGEAIGGSGQASIDAYLNHNRDKPNYNVLGKAAIAQVLLRREAELGLGRLRPLGMHTPPDFETDDWLLYLFRAMARGLEGSGYEAAKHFVEENQVSFVTFNYDCFLERWLHARLKASFGLTEDQALELVPKIRICHVFGSLGTYPHTIDLKNEHGGPWTRACTHLKLIHEAESEHEDVAKAKSFLKAAKVLCILGFGFHEENVELIGLDAAVQDCGLAAASAFGLTDVEWSRLTRQLFDSKKIKRGKQDWKCTRIFKNFEVL